MRSLDKFYKYIENHEAKEPKKTTGEDAAAEPPSATETTPVSAPPGMRYVIRNGVTVSVPRETAVPPSPEPATGKEVEGDSAAFDEQDAVPETSATDELSDDGSAVWHSLPESVQRLALLSQDLLPEAAPQSAERRQLIERLLNPLITLEDTARLLGVCTATVRRYANKGALPHQRTIGQQRRFLLADVLGLMESRKPEEETR